MAAAGAIEFRVDRPQPDGSRLVLDVTANYLEGADLIISYGRDVTARVAAEELARASEAQYRRIVEIANEGIWACDGEFRTTFVNAQMAAMLGYEPEEMIGRQDIEFVHPDDVALLRREGAARRRGVPGTYECRFVAKDGATVWVHISSVADLGPDGEFVRARSPCARTSPSAGGPRSAAGRAHQPRGDLRGVSRRDARVRRGRERGPREPRDPAAGRPRRARPARPSARQRGAVRRRPRLRQSPAGRGRLRHVARLSAVPPAERRPGRARRPRLAARRGARPRRRQGRGACRRVAARRRRADGHERRAARHRGRRRHHRPPARGARAGGERGALPQPGGARAGVREHQGLGAPLRLPELAAGRARRRRGRGVAGQASGGDLGAGRGGRLQRVRRSGAGRREGRRGHPAAARRRDEALPRPALPDRCATASGRSWAG